MISLDKATFEVAIAEIVETPANGDFKHPFLTSAKFILADNKPNQNKQGIEAEDFDQVIQSAIAMPVKMRFNRRSGLQNHMGAIPLGHIQSVEKVLNDDGTYKLVASAALWNDEYPDEIQFLKDEFSKSQRNEGDPPRISYEMAYADSVTKDGTQWLKKPTTLGATFVKTPAYGSRTALLALASADEISLPELAREILLMAKAEDMTTDIATKKGGKNVEDKELQELKEKLQKVETDLNTARTEASTKGETISSLESKLLEKDTALQTLTDKVTTMEKANLIDSRVRKLSDNGITLEADAEKAAKKKDFWASMSDDSFDEYVSDLLAAKKSTASPTKIALASLQQSSMPKPTITDIQGTLNTSELLGAISALKNK